MKRFFIFMLIAALLLSGCSITSPNMKEPVEFYYLRSCSENEDYKAYFSDGAIVAELREASGHKEDLFYLISMYLRGPLTTELVSPFPSGSAVTRVIRDGETLYVNLNAAAANAEDLELTLVWACLAKTCMALTDATAIRIESRSTDGQMLFQHTVTRDTLIWDESLPTAAESAAQIQ